MDIKVRDSNGALLAEGDSVTLIKDLKLKGSSTVLKRGTMIKDGVYQTGLARPIVRAGRKGDYFEIRPEAMFEMTRPD